MNRKLGQLIKATLLALPLALPSVALAQDSAERNSDLERNPPAGSLDSSGSSTSRDRDLGGDINKSNDDAAKMSSDSTTTSTHKKTKKTVKRTTTSDLSDDTSR